MATDTNQPKSTFLPWLAANRTMAGTGLMIAGAAIAVLPVLLATWYGTDFLMTVVFTGLLAFVVLAIGVSIRFLPAEATNEPDRLLGLALALGGLGGLLVALTGLALLVHWWAFLTDWLSLGKREDAWRVLLALAVLLVGLFVMFWTLQLGRADERRNPTVRRLMYGYNVAFSGLLLLLILAVVNVLVGLKIAWAVDATSTGEYSLSSMTANKLQGLDRPLRFFVIWDLDDPRLGPLRSLLDNFQDRSKRVDVRYVSPADFGRLEELKKKFGRKMEPTFGALVIYGEDDKPENATYLKEGDLFEEGFRDSAARFRGEDKIVAAISALEGGGQKSVVYFTQGMGEPSLTDTSPSPTTPGGETGLGALRDRLNARGNFDVKPLKLSAAEPKIPDDCKLLVVANPRPPVDPVALQSIRKYVVEQKGKAVFLVDIPSPPAGETIPATGLEGLLAEFNVEITNERVFSLGAEQYGNQLVLSGADGGVFEVDPQLAQARSNEVATAFVGYPITLRSVRVVRPAAGGARRPDLQAQTLLVSRTSPPVWTDSKWDPNINEMIRGIAREDPQAIKRLARDPQPAAVLVTEGGKPRLAVFGDASFVNNRSVGERSANQNFSLFASTLDWLGERPTSIGIEPRNLAVYSLSPTARFWYMVFLPGVLAVMAVLGLGLGVWVVRRR
jgi:hypothetical protein